MAVVAISALPTGQVVGWAAGVAGAVAGAANLASALTLTDKTNAYLTLDTRTGVSGVKALTLAVGTAVSFAAAAGNAFSAVAIPAYTLTQTGSTLVTALSGLSLNIASPTVTDASALTVTTASAMVVNGPLPAGSVTFTRSVALDIPSYATNGTLACGLRVFNPSGASTNANISVVAAGGTPGTNEGQIWHDGTNLNIWNAQTANTAYTLVFDNIGNITAYQLAVTASLSFVDSTTRLSRVVSGVIAPAGTANGWLQNTGGVAVLAANFTDAVGTLTATNLSWTVIAGRFYDIDLEIKISNSLAADGFQMNFAGGTCSATTFWAMMNTEVSGGTEVAGTLVSTTLATVLNYTTITGTNYVRIKGRLKVNAGGTLIIKAATNTTVSGTMTLAALSGGLLSDVVAL